MSTSCARAHATNALYARAPPTRHRQAPLHAHATARAAPIRLPVASIDAVAAQPLQVLVKGLAALRLHERLKVGAVLADERNEAGPQVAVLRAVGMPSQLVAQRPGGPAMKAQSASCRRGSAGQV